MKKRMAIVLSAVMTLAMGTTAMAAPSPSITTETVQQVVVSSSIGGNGQAVSLSGQQTATLPGTTFVTAGGQTIDASAVAVVSAPSTAEQAQAAAASLVAALASSDMRVMNFTGPGSSVPDGCQRKSEYCKQYDHRPDDCFWRGGIPERLHFRSVCSE